jgi:hypothetical protein
MVSYTVTVCNEDRDLDKLLKLLQSNIKEDDEIVVQMDSMSVTSAVRNVIDSYRDKIKNLVVVEFPLDKDFAQFKNNLKLHCSKEWIFNVDADELPSGYLLENMHSILIANSQVDMFLVPRWNTVDGITDSHIEKWGWFTDELGRINWPDYQTRIYRNKEGLVWKNKVHERLSGYNSYANLPDDDAHFCLFHNKTIDRQEKQNNFYTTI